MTNNGHNRSLNVMDRVQGACTFICVYEVMEGR